MRTSAIFSILILLVSCTSLKKTKRNYDFDSNDEQGLVVASISVPNDSENIDVLYLTFDKFSEGPDKLARFGYNLILKNKRHKPDTIVNSEKVFYIIGKRKARKYHLFEYEIIKDSKVKRENIKKSLSIPFDVENGKVNYIGNYKFYPNKNKNGFYFELTNKLNRDINQLQNIYPNIDWNEIESQIVNPNDNAIEF